jgi:hypothetical protein
VLLYSASDSEALGIDAYDADALANAAALSFFCTDDASTAGWRLRLLYLLLYLLLYSLYLRAAEHLLEVSLAANPSHVSTLCNYGQLLLTKVLSVLCFTFLVSLLNYLLVLRAAVHAA